MYGMVHEALGQLVSRRAGPEVWERVCARAGAPTSAFPSFSVYPDEVTVGLVVASADELGLGVDELLVQFGHDWIAYALTTSYGPLLRSSGRTLEETLGSLDGLHARIAMALPQLRPPSFRVASDGSGGMTLHYFSPRTGLAAFVVGLVHGLASMHDTTVDVVHTASRADGADHDEFLITPGAG